jgi:hypothetical protein
VAFQKTEPIGGGSLMLRAEIINIFSNTQFNGPNTTFGSSSFGRISSTRGSAHGAAHGAVRVLGRDR